MEGQIEMLPLSDSAEASLNALKVAREALADAQKAIQASIRVVNKTAREIEDSRGITVVWAEE